MIDGLTKPTRGRIALWIVLAILWALFLPQQIAHDPDFDNFSVAGAVLWVVVLAGLGWMAFATLKRRSDERRTSR